MQDEAENIEDIQRVSSTKSPVENSGIETKNRESDKTLRVLEQDVVDQVAKVQPHVKNLQRDEPVVFKDK